MSNNKHKILIIEDEANIRSFIQTILETGGYQVLTAATCRQGKLMFSSHMPDMVILDLGLPDSDGLDFIRSVRTISQTPILVLSARTTEEDKVVALDLGANDYMTKPFAIEELLARIRVALKSRSGEVKKDEKQLTYGKLTVDLATRQVSFGGEPLTLTKKEFDLLAFLLKNKNRAVPREELLSAVWDYDYAGDTNVVDVYVRYLRQKVEEPLGLRLIETVRGVGYMIRNEK